MTIIGNTWALFATRSVGYAAGIIGAVLFLREHPTSAGIAFGISGIAFAQGAAPVQAMIANIACGTSAGYAAGYNKRCP